MKSCPLLEPCRTGIQATLTPMSTTVTSLRAAAGRPSLETSPQPCLASHWSLRLALHLSPAAPAPASSLAPVHSSRDVADLALSRPFHGSLPLAGTAPDSACVLTLIPGVSQWPPWRPGSPAHLQGTVPTSLCLLSISHSRRQQPRPASSLLHLPAHSRCSIHILDCMNDPLPSHSGQTDLPAFL